MAGEAYAIPTANNSSCGSKKGKDNKKKKKRGGSKKKMTVEQTLALKSVREWVFSDQSGSFAAAASCVVDDFGVQKSLNGRGGDKLVFELHSHSKCSDGFLSPSKLVERAHGNGVSFFFFFFCPFFFWGFFGHKLKWVVLLCVCVYVTCDFD